MIVISVLPEDYKLDPEEKSRWLEALRSGEYKQGTGWLREGDRFCCLGVRLDLLNKFGWDGDPQGVMMFGDDLDDSALPDSFCYQGNSDYREMPFNVTSEMYEAFPWLVHLVPEKDYISLALLNDRGATFNQIADLIEYRF